jgi:ketosteroid isomerase-like protein
VRSGNVGEIVATYTEHAVDCGATGECFIGRARIEKHMTTQFAELGRALSASVQSWGSAEYGSVVYEWGQAEATFKSRKLVEKYLTVWEKQSDGSWKILRNMVIPEK